MPAVVPAVLDQTRLDVVDKARSNIFKWRGQFTPQFVEYLLDTYAVSTDLVFDPFCGSGTVLLESARKNLKSSGCEINPAAYAMAKFITLSNLQIEERQQVFNSVKARIEKLIKSYDDLPLFQVQPSFRNRYKNLLHFAGDLFAQIDNKREKLLAVIVLFHAEAIGKGNLVHSVRRACEIVEAKLLALPFSSSELSVDLCDARLAHKRFNCTVDVIITSPPYINVFNYHQNYRAIMEVLGFDLLKIAESEIGSNRKNRGNRFRTVVQYTLDMEQALVSFARSLKVGGLLILVVGRESRVRGIPFSNSGILKKLTEELHCYKWESENERVFTNRFGLLIKEDILVFRRTGQAPLEGSAREIAKEYLEKAVSVATGDVRNDVMETLAHLDDVKPSPLFNKKGII
jgi:SAM-dependent methyltransferase